MRSSGPSRARPARTRVTVRIPRAGLRTVLAVGSRAIAGARAHARQRAVELAPGRPRGRLRRDHARGVSPRAWRPLIQHRARQGHTTALVDVEDLYDEFTFGQKSPWAIKAFLARARASWATPPRFVVLVGNASADPRNYLRAYAADPDVNYVPDSDYVPTKLVETRALEDRVGRLVRRPDEDGIAELAVGRFSVLTASQATAVVAEDPGLRTGAGGRLDETRAARGRREGSRISRTSKR